MNAGLRLLLAHGYESLKHITEQDLLNMPPAAQSGSDVLDAALCSLGTAIGHGGEFEQPLQILIGLVFSSVSSPDKLSHPGVRPIRLLLLALSPTSSRHDTPTTSRFGGSQAETGGNGYESTSRAVHRRCVLPAAMAGVRCR